jgi:hypothetical protein
MLTLSLYHAPGYTPRLHRRKSRLKVIQLTGYGRFGERSDTIEDCSIFFEPGIDSGGVIVKVCIKSSVAR